MGLTLSGCSTTRFISVRYLPGRSLLFFVPLCGDERVRQLQVREVVDEKDPSHDRLLWTVRSTGAGAPLAQIEFGTRPVGFSRQGSTSVGELSAKYSDRLLVVSASTDRSSLLSTFTLADLPTDGRAVHEGTRDRVMSMADLKEAQRDECSPSAIRTFAVFAASIAFVGGAVAGVLLLRRRRRSGGRRDIEPGMRVGT
jgi:hypothetical protein